MRARIVASGIVQGVGFRPFVYRTATRNALVGFVRNRGDAGVEIVVQGAEQDVRRFLEALEREKPPLARYDSIDVRFEEDIPQLAEFAIVPSSEDRQLSGAAIPPDVATCGNCVRELRNPGDRRHDYFFITCTDCGPRFTIVERLPYDRPNTTMKEFGLCTDCQKEYADPLARRFHAETIACPACGPRVFLTDRQGQVVNEEDPIQTTGELVQDGFIVGIKGIGGFHIAASAVDPEPLRRLRQLKHRRQKSFAVMARDLESAKGFAVVTPEEERLLLSDERPIVLLEKSESYYLSDLVSPGLHNVGVMLPYTALHMMLFDRSREPAFVMTSGNLPSEPLVKDNDEALAKLGPFVDNFLLHNRRIAHRCDDSVIRVNDGRVSPIRRSRGYAPAPVALRRRSRACIWALGAELMVTCCVLLDDKAFLSQHVGDLETLENYLFLREASGHLLELLNARPELVACDLHPTMHTTRLAERTSEERGWTLVRVQHHHAHAASLMAEAGVNELVAITCDGIGYGTDGTIWGGEVLVVDGARFTRAGHLEPQPMPGGDLATYYPVRMAAAMLQRVTDPQDYLYSHAHALPGGRNEGEVILAQLRKGKHPVTTSAGRVLDAAAVVLGLCYERTYEGEPAMKLEAAARAGREVMELEPEIRRGVLGTSNLLHAILEARPKHRIPDLAHSVEAYVAKGLAQIAIDVAEGEGIKHVGFTGGVAANAHIARVIRALVEQQGFAFVSNHQVPPGDGGLSLGQAYVASLAR